MINFERKLKSNLFSSAEINPLLYPLIFKMPRLSGKATNDYHLYQQVKSFSDDEDFPQIDVFNDELFSHQELRKFYEVQLEFIKEQGSDAILSEDFIRLCDYLENPFHYFLMMHDHEEENVDNKLLEAFPELLREINRDNIITESEKNLLIDKAKELGLPADEIDHFQNRRFIGYKTFRVLVDQVCEDGVVTDSERSFILEKANQYNVPQKIVSKLLKRGLAKAKVIQEKSVDEDFFLYVIAFFTVRFIEKSLHRDIISDNLTENIFNVDSLTNSSVKKIKENVLEALEDSLSTYLNTSIEVNNVKVFLRNLGIKTLSKERAMVVYESSIEERTIEDFRKKYTSSTKEFKGFLYQVEYKSVNSNDLFNFATKGDEVTIELNTDHPLVTHQMEHLEILEFFLISLISTKLEYTNSNQVDHFWSLFKLYQQHYTLVNH